MNFRINNFDLIRLLAALQVAVYHSLNHMQIEGKDSIVLKFASNFPGVPIFFFISGFLITKSYENNNVFIDYAVNRIVRIYPALILCTFLSAASLFYVGYLNLHTVNFFDFSLWFLSQTTFFQFYNPDFLRGFGVGVLNGSLWTITVELQFYFLVPIVYYFFGDKTGKGFSNSKLFAMLVFFMIINRLYVHFYSYYSEQIVYKVIGVSFAPWFYMFLLGMFFQRNYEFFHRHLSRRFIVAVIIYLAFVLFAGRLYDISMGNNIDPVCFVLLGAVIFSLAFTWERLSYFTLRGNDISYGIYLYHMPVTNFFIFLGKSEDIKHWAVQLLIVVIVSISSWYVIEKPFLRIKKHSSYEHN